MNDKNTDAGTTAGGYYGRNYDTLKRFISYYYQVHLAKETVPGTILEIGTGNKTVSNYLRQHGYKIFTCDYNKKLLPDCISDIRKLPFRKDSFDTVMACEILEHLPWDEAGSALRELHRVAKKNLIVSLPYSASVFEFIMHLPIIHRLVGKHYIELFFRIPHFFLEMKPFESHRWEIGRKGYPAGKVRAMMIAAGFTIKKEVRPTLDSYHHFFVLEKFL